MSRPRQHAPETDGTPRAQASEADNASGTENGSLRPMCPISVPGKYSACRPSGAARFTPPVAPGRGIWRNVDPRDRTAFHCAKYAGSSGTPKTQESGRYPLGNPVSRVDPALREPSNSYGDVHATSFKANRRASSSPHEACRLAVRHPEGNRGEIAGSTPARFMDCRHERVDVREKSGDRERPDDADSRLREC